MTARFSFHLALGALALGALLLAAAPARAQVADSARADTTAQPGGARSDSVHADTAQVGGPLRAPADTTAADTTAADTTAGGTPDRPAPSGSAENVPEGAVQFSARDSLVILFDEAEGDVGTLYGETEMTYGETTLSAYAVDMLMEQDELRARGLPVDTGLVGRPRFQRGEGEAFTGQSLAYNLRTNRGRVVGARTSIREGLIEGDVVKTMEDSTIYVKDGLYTTCDCLPSETPSYSLQSDRMKIKGKWAYTGPIQLYIFNIPMPLWLPFGFLPATEGRRSGPLPPTYGEDQRGFYLRGWGWYQAINEYTDFQVTGGIWTQGSYEISPRFRYNKRYRYRGDLDLSYQLSKSGDVVDPGYAKRRDVSIRWQHQQTINPTSSLSGNVRLASQNQLRFDSDNYDDNVTNRIGSSINYSKSWGGGRRSLRAVISQDQTLTTGQASLTLPNISFSQASFQPFERERRAPGQEEAWYERISTSYRGSLQNRYTFNPRDSTAAGEPINIAWYEALFSLSKYRRATGDDEPFQFSATHTVPVSANFTVGQVPLLGNLPINLSPNVNYREDWFIRTTRLRPVDSTRTDTTSLQVERVSVPGFFAERTFTTGVSANTRFYGLFPVRLGPFSGLRHTVAPSLSFSYQPDFNADFYGRTRTYRGEDGRPVRYNIVTGSRVGRSSEQRTLSFSLDNVFETRRVRYDSTGTEQTTTLKLLDLDLSTGYNFAADSLRLSDISLNARTDLLEQFNFRFSARFSPYVYENGREVNRFVFREPGDWRLARLTSLNLSARTTLDGGAGRGGAGRSRQPARTSAEEFFDGGDFDEREQEGLNSQRGSFREDLTDFSIPYSLDFSFTYGLSGAGRLRPRATLNTGFNLNLTPAWKVTGDTGYDFVQRELVPTRINITRDFECWQMNFNWVPFGRLQQYGFSLYVKSGKLRNLLRLDLPNSGGVRDRFGGLIQQ